MALQQAKDLALDYALFEYGDIIYAYHGCYDCGAWYAGKIAAIDAVLNIDADPPVFEREYCVEIEIEHRNWTTVWIWEEDLLSSTEFRSDEDPEPSMNYP